MDEQRMQAYVELIEQLLGCAQGEQEALLQANADLVDSGLVDMMERYANLLEKAGKPNVGWLRHYSFYLTQRFGLEESSVKPADFMLEVVNFVVKVRGDQTKVYEFFQANLERLDDKLLQEFTLQFLKLTQAISDGLIAQAFFEFGNLIQRFPHGSRMLNLELSCAAYELVLLVYTRDDFPEDWAGVQHNLATAYSNRIRGEKAENLELAITAYQKALQVYTREAFPQDWAMTQNGLANAYAQRIRGERAENLEQAIDAYQQVCQVRTRDTSPEKWAMTQNNLANAYSDRIRGDIADNLERAIDSYEQALQVYDRDAFPTNWAMVQNGLANAYVERIRGERAENLERAINIYEQVVQVYTQDDFPEKWAITQNNLASAYSNRIRGGKSENLEKGISAYQKALQVYTHAAFPEQWARVQTNLAMTYSDRIRGERSENLERAISAYEQALQVRTYKAFPEDWAATQNSLGSAYCRRIEGRTADNIERAIDAYQQALLVRTCYAFPKDWAATQNNLAIAYRQRIQEGKSENIEQAIYCYQQALQVYTCNTFPQDWAMTQHNLALAYADRIRGERADNLERAIAAYELALQVRTCDAFPQDWAMTQNNLALAYADRIRGERADNLERAIAAYEQALQIYTRNAFPQYWAGTQNNLANAYLYRIRGERTDNLERAIAAYELALQIRTCDAFPRDWAMTQNNLAGAYLYRIRGERADNLERAIAAYELALQVRMRDAFSQDWAETQNNLAFAYADRIRGERADNLERAIAAYELALQVRTCDVFPKDCRQTAQNLGNLHWQEKSWAAAVDVYRIATAATETLYQSSISYAGKGDELKATGDIPRRLAYAQTQIGDYPTAVLTLEQGRARGLSESLDRDRADLTQLQTLAPNLYTEYQEITQQLRNLENNDRDRMISTDRDRIPENLITTTTQLRSDLEATIAQIRQVPTYEDLLTPTKWEDITIALRPDNPLLYVVTTPNGSVTIVVTPDNTEAIWSDFTEAQLQELVQDWFKAYNNSQTDRQTWYNTIESTTRDLWDLLMGPIVQHLKSKGFDRATLIPTGYLSLLPLHAAWTPDTTRPTGKRYALDDIHFTYTPNAKSLTEARAIAERPFANSILAIDNPRQDLPNSQREIDCAIESFGDRSTVLRHGEATIDAVKSGLSEAAIVHFSCHGTANFTEPLNSGLLMSDGLLTLKDLLALNLAQDSGIRLAILSACETGLPGLDNIDEVVSLPIGLLQAGVAGVISSLWSVSDLSTMLLLTKFYELWREQKLPPDQALRQAQIWLRDSTNAEKVIEFKNTIDQTRMPASTAQQLFDELAWETKNERSFNHPFYWAAFSYTGI